MEKTDVVGVKYSSGVIPEGYKCSNCSVHGVKLWREYQTNPKHLLCADCSEEDQKKCHEAGWQSEFSQKRGSEIGWYIPAVPVEGNDDAFWALRATGAKYQEGKIWWWNLPTRIPCILVGKQGNDYIASVKGQEEIAVSGSTTDGVIGNLIRLHAEKFNINIEYQH